VIGINAPIGKPKGSMKMKVWETKGDDFAVIFGSDGYHAFWKLDVLSK